VLVLEERDLVASIRALQVLEEALIQQVRHRPAGEDRVVDDDHVEPDAGQALREPAVGVDLPEGEAGIPLEGVDVVGDRRRVRKEGGPVIEEQGSSHVSRALGHLRVGDRRAGASSLRRPSLRIEAT
jgi:hypothetical protein